MREKKSLPQQMWKGTDSVNSQSLSNPEAAPGGTCSGVLVAAACSGGDLALLVMATHPLTRSQHSFLHGTIVPWLTNVMEPHSNEHCKFVFQTLNNIIYHNTDEDHCSCLPRNFLDFLLLKITEVDDLPLVLAAAELLCSLTRSTPEMQSDLMISGFRMVAVALLHWCMHSSIPGSQMILQKISKILKQIIMHLPTPHDLQQALHSVRMQNLLHKYSWADLMHDSLQPLLQPWFLEPVVYLQDEVLGRVEKLLFSGGHGSRETIVAEFLDDIFLPMIVQSPSCPITESQAGMFVKLPVSELFGWRLPCSACDTIDAQKNDNDLPMISSIADVLNKYLRQQGEVGAADYHIWFHGTTSTLAMRTAKSGINVERHCVEHHDFGGPSIKLWKSFYVGSSLEAEFRKGKQKCRLSDFPAVLVFVIPRNKLEANSGTLLNNHEQWRMVVVNSRKGLWPEEDCIDDEVQVEDEHADENEFPVSSSMQAVFRIVRYNCMWLQGPAANSHSNLFDSDQDVFATDHEQIAIKHPLAKQARSWLKGVLFFPNQSLASSVDNCT